MNKYKIYSSVKSKIFALNFLYFLTQSITYFIQFLTAFLFIICILSFIPISQVNPVAKLTSLIICLIVLLFLFFRMIYEDFRFDTKKIFTLIESNYKFLGDDTLSSIQLMRSYNTSKDLISSSVIISLLKDVENRLKEVKFSKIANLSPLKINITFFLTILLFTILSIFYNKSFIKNINALYSSPLFPEEKPISFTINPGDAKIIFGNDLKIKVKLSKKIYEPVMIYQTRNVNLVEGYNTFETNPLERIFTFRSVTSQFKYYVKIGKLRSRVYVVDVLNPPSIKNIYISVIPPVYTNFPPLYLSQFDNITAPAGAQITFDIIPSKKIKTALIQFNDTDGISNLKMQESKDYHYVARFNLVKDHEFKVIVYDNENLSNEPSPVYKIDVIEDKPPVILIKRPGIDLDLPAVEKLNMEIEAEDDYLLTDIYLYYSINDGKKIELKLPFSPVKKIEFDYLWDLSLLGVFPGDSISYYATAKDNDALSGGNISRSKLYKINIISPIEDLREISMMQDKDIDNLKELIENKEVTRKELSGIKNKILEKGKLDESNRAETEKLIKKEELLKKEAEEIADDLNKILDRMDQNKLITPETLFKIQRISKLLQEVLTDEMKDILNKINSTLEKIDIQSLQLSFSSLEEESNKILKSLDTTIELLERIKVEQKIEALISNLENMINAQKDYLESIKEIKNRGEKIKQSEKDDEIRDAIKDESEILKDMQSSKELMDSLSKDLEKVSPDAAKELKTIIRDNLNSCDCLSKSINFLRKQNLNPAMQSGENGLKNMVSLSEKLKEMKSSLLTDMKRNYENLLQRAIYNALNFSFSVEEGIKELEKTTELNPIGGKGMFEKEAKLTLFHKDFSRNFADEIIDLSKAAPFMDIKIVDIVFSLVKKIDDSLKSLENGNGVGGYNLKKDAFNDLNKIMVMLLQSKWEDDKASLSSEFEKYLKKLEMLSQMQKDLNKSTKDAFSIPIPGKGALSELAAQQILISKALQSLQGEMQDAKELTSKLGKVKEEMDEIAEAIEGGDISRKVQKRQSNVLRRLMDTQLSLRKSGYKKERKAETAKEFIHPPSPVLTSTDKIKIPQEYIDELKNSYRQPYIKGYEEMIKEYYENLFKQLNIF